MSSSKACRMCCSLCWKAWKAELGRFPTGGSTPSRSAFSPVRCCWRTGLTLLAPGAEVQPRASIQRGRGRAPGRRWSLVACWRIKTPPASTSAAAGLGARLGQCRLRRQRPGCAGWPRWCDRDCADAAARGQHHVDDLAVPVAGRHECPVPLPPRTALAWSAGKDAVAKYEGYTDAAR